MDALKQAEAGQAEQTAPAPPGTQASASPEPAPAQKTQPNEETSAAPGISMALSAADELRLLDEDSPPPPSRTAQAHQPRKPLSPQSTTAHDDAVSRQRSAAHALLNKPHQSAPPPRIGLWLLTGLASLIGAAIAGYVWWQIQPRNSLVASGTQLPARPPIPAPPPAVSPPPPLLAASPLFPPVSTTLPVPALAPATPAPAPRRGRLGEPSSTPVPPSGRITIRQGVTQPNLNSAVDRGYRAIQAGRHEDARRAYLQALRQDPRQTDALLGMAALSELAGQDDQAAAYYQAVLEAEPKHPAALSALANRHAATNPLAAESRLHQLVETQPQSAAAHFALGSLMASQQRWAEAQAAFFAAHTLDATHPDYLFNLAVSLDALRQSKLAVDFYQAALTASKKRSATFPAEDVTTRLRELRGTGAQ